MMRPRVHVNCAMTADGKIAGRSRRQVRISSPEDMERVRRLRMESDAILVGIGTILSDDPHLTVKDLPPEQNPLRVVLDSRGRTPDEASVLDTKARTLIATAEDCDRTWRGVEVVRFGVGRVDISRLLEHLEAIGVRTLLVEGGGEVMWSFFEGGFVDRYTVFVGSLILGGRTAPTPVDGEGFLGNIPLKMRLVQCERLGAGVLLGYEVEHD